MEGFSNGDLRPSKEQCGFNTFSPLFPNFPPPQAPNQWPRGMAHYMNNDDGTSNGFLHIESSSPSVEMPPILLLNNANGPLFSTSISASGIKIRQPSHLNSIDSCWAEGTGGKKAKLADPAPMSTRNEACLHIGSSCIFYEAPPTMVIPVGHLPLSGIKIEQIEQPSHSLAPSHLDRYGFNSSAVERSGGKKAKLADSVPMSNGNGVANDSLYTESLSPSIETRAAFVEPMSYAVGFSTRISTSDIKIEQPFHLDRYGFSNSVVEDTGGKKARLVDRAPMSNENGTANGSLHNRLSSHSVETCPSVEVPLSSAVEPLFSTRILTSCIKVKQPSHLNSHVLDSYGADGTGMSTGNGAANGSLHTGSLSPFVETPPTVVIPLNNTTSCASGCEQPSHVNNQELSSSGAKGTGGKKAKRKHRMKAHKDQLMVTSSDDARESVEVVLMTLDAIIRRLSQLDEVKDMGLRRRPDLKAGTIMHKNGLRTNKVKMIGPVAGVEVGDLFYLRIEMCLVGLHTQSVAGIDYKTVRFGDDHDLVALSIVSAGGYENDEGDVDVLVYSGHGGGNGSTKSDKKQVDDQKLEGGNLALEKSFNRANQIRVIRSQKDISRQYGKLYIYDGLYKIRESWVEKGKSGFNLFKYKLQREPGQPDGFAVWKMARKWKENPSSRGNVISPDASSGLENIPICVVNDVDDEKGPSCFTYATEVKYLNPIRSMKPLQGCMCHSSCLPGDGNCYCTQRNMGDLPFSSNRLLVSRKPLIYECGASCQCSVNCRNRVTQKGIGHHFEIFKTKDRGWGLRSWDPIRAGTFICEYIGEVIDMIKLEEDGEDDEYIFHSLNARDKASRWNHGPELLGEPSCTETSETSEPLPIILSAKKMGNVSRFINHSCSPNLFWQPVLHDHDDEGYPHIMFFALKHIPPMTELTYDYIGMASGGMYRRIMNCLCGSSKCRGYFG